MSDSIIPDGGGLFDEIDGHLRYHRKREDEQRAQNPPPGPEPTVQADGRPTLIIPGDPDGPCSFVPTVQQFDHLETDFLGSTELRQIGEGLIERHLWLSWLGDQQIGYLWARKGATKHEHPVLGTLSKPSGPLRFFSGYDYLVTIAADHATEYQLTNYQVQALVFHELQHARKSEKGKLTMRGHDLEMFNADVTVYGLCFADLKRASRAFEQASIDFGEGE